MGREIDIDSIRTLLDEQIEQYETALIKLKRARNSLLNISILPPEILGQIFHWNTIPNETCGGFGNGCHNFLVCHHWFQVAASTRALVFLGNSLQDWAKRHHRHQGVPLDLVLYKTPYTEDTLDDTIRIALQDRAARGTIRRIHLFAGDSEFLGSIISPLTANYKGIQSSNLESLILWDHDGSASIDISDFLAHYRFPKLRHFELLNCTMSWDLLVSRTSVLTTLDLEYLKRSPPPTTSQLSILASNPTLRKVRPCGHAIPNDGGGRSSFRVTLRHLKVLELHVGDLRNIVGLLRRLDHGRNVDLNLDLSKCAVGDISWILAPYLRDYLQHRSRSHGGLGLSVSWGDWDIRFDAGDGGGIDLSAPEPKQMIPFMGITVHLNDTPPKNVLEGAILDLIAYTPQEQVVYFRVHQKPLTVEDIHARLPNLRVLHFNEIPLIDAFPKPNLGWDEGILPS